MGFFKNLFGGAGANNTNDANRLISHIANNDWNRLKADIAAGANVNVKDEHGQTALMVASSCGLDQIVQTLVVAGADVNAKDNKGKTALMHAAGGSGYGGREIIKILLAASADVNTKDYEGKTALRSTRFSSDADGKATVLKAAGAKE